MPEATHAKPTSPIRLNNPVAEIFARTADRWFATQAALLADVDALTHAWLHRRRASVAPTKVAIQQMAGCRNPEEMLHVHQKWLSGAFSRVAEDIAAFNASISSIAKGATADLERAAAEITAPIQAVGEEESKAGCVRSAAQLIEPARSARPRDVGSRRAVAVVSTGPAR
jgi:hypothetical protein